MSHQLDAVRSLAATLRHNPGSMRTGGIEDQLTWLSALAYYARHLAKNTDEIPSPYDSSPRWREMDAATRENYQSMLAALDDRPPTHIPRPNGHPDPGERRHHAHRQPCAGRPHANQSDIAGVHDRDQTRLGAGPWWREAADSDC